MKNDKHLDAVTKREFDDLLAEIGERAKTFVGYPCNAFFDYSELYPFLQYCLNNVGDPFGKSNFSLNTYEIERKVLGFFAELTRAPEDDFWGYVTNGGTEGNMYGLFLARELLPDGVVYYSEDTHYSVAKILRVLQIRHIMIKSLDNGELDYHDLHETIRIHRDVPPIIMANIGTTMKGAVDDISKINEVFHDLAVPSHYIHCDAALSGMILPFVEEPQPFGFESGIDSISISGHKMIGSPIPCGIVLAKKRNVDKIARSIEYVGILDTTLSGSRNAITPLFLWYAINKLGREGFTQMVRQCLETAEYAVNKFKENGIEAWRNTNSVTVVFPRPTERILGKWQLAVYEQIGHLITMPHVTREKVDELAEDLVEDMQPAQ